MLHSPDTAWGQPPSLGVATAALPAAPYPWTQPLDVQCLGQPQLRSAPVDLFHRLSKLLAHAPDGN